MPQCTPFFYTPPGFVHPEKNMLKHLKHLVINEVMTTTLVTILAQFECLEEVIIKKKYILRPNGGLIKRRDPVTKKRVAQSQDTTDLEAEWLRSGVEVAAARERNDKELKMATGSHTFKLPELSFVNSRRDWQPTWFFKFRARKAKELTVLEEK
ncbi:uncharacterized protein LY89DRAFT_731782 [Mollisia scopiformis]|uniref:Uncharacterized protein n=1 Tax=Mollisia scopiformis TaxID=149040 RepID=A0A194XGT5_MOLSC|nr:uncharacterized protein LY89DRAFT_731782 [Mollisia scopiformis]KUJ19383.1 hypothetical protein LY89DRAFT_731782 [Mollisia scopiformis]